MAVIHWKSVAYATTNFAATMMNSVFAFYYVNVYLGRFHVQEFWFHLAQTIFMIWNAVNDPLFGYVQDNYSCFVVKTRRHSILYGAPLFVLSFIMFWFPWDQSNTSPWISGCQLLFALCFYDTMFTFVLLAECALFTEMSTKQEDRMRLIWYSQLASLLGSGAVYICESISHHLEDFHSFQMCCVLIALLALMAMTYTGIYAHTEVNHTEKEEELGKPPEENSEQEAILKKACQILRQRNFITFVLMNFCQIYAYTFSDNFSSIICDHLISNKELGPRARSIFYSLMFILPPLTVVIGSPVVRRFGYYQVIKASFQINIITSLCLLATGPTALSIMLYYLITRVCTNGAFSLFNLSLSDIIDEDKKMFSRSYRLSAMVYGINALITKPAISLAPMITDSVLNRYGYQRLNAAAQSGEDATMDWELNRAMFHLLVWTPLLLATVQLCVWSCYGIRNSHLTDPKMYGN